MITTLGASRPTRLLPADLNAVGQRFAAGQADLDRAVVALGSSLGGSGGMAGDDEPGPAFAIGYDEAARSAMAAFGSGVRSLGGVADGLVTSANNHNRADNHSTAGGSTQLPFPAPGTLATPTAVSAPSAAGGGAGGFALPGTLAEFWPAGDPGRLREAASAWRRCASTASDVGNGLHGAIAGLGGANTGPSMSLIEQFWGRIWGSGDLPVLGAAVTGSTTLADACDAYAQYVDDVRREVEEVAIEVVAVTAAGLLLTVFTVGASDVVAAAGDAALVLRAAEAARHLVELAHVVSIPLLHTAPLLDRAAVATPPALVVSAAETEQVLQQLPGTMPDAGPPSSIPQRLSILYERLDRLGAASTADEALEQISTTLVQVEDEYSGVLPNPNPGLEPDGRMYPPHADRIRRWPDGRITAVTKGNIIEIETNGAFRILDRRSGGPVFRRPGGR